MPMPTPIHVMNIRIIAALCTGVFISVTSGYGQAGQLTSEWVLFLFATALIVATGINAGVAYDHVMKSMWHLSAVAFGAFAAAALSISVWAQGTNFSKIEFTAKQIAPNLF